MNKALVIGGSGFIGKNLKFVNSITKDKIQLFGFEQHEKFRLNEIEKIGKFLTENQIPTIISLAWSLRGDYRNDPGNFQLAEETFALYQALDGITRRFISIGTFSEIMDDLDGGGFQDKSFYAESKRILASALSESVSPNSHSINLRIGFPYGPWDREARLIPYLITSLKDKCAPVLRNPDVTLPIVHVFDVVLKVLSIAQNREIHSNTSINFFGESFLTVGQIQRKLEDLFLVATSGVKISVPDLCHLLSDSIQIDIESGLIDLLFREKLI